ncbi:hypothetical protein [Streptomyces sp. NPDC000878]
MSSQDVRREEPRETPAHDDRVPPAPTATLTPTARPYGRVHLSTPLVAVS